MLAALVSAVLLASADQPAKAAAPASPAPSASAVKAKGPEITCWVEMPTGSHLAKRICATREELDQAQREAKAALDVGNHGPAALKPK